MISKRVVTVCLFVGLVSREGVAGEVSIVNVASKSSILNVMDDGTSFQTVGDSVKPNLFQKNGFNFLAGCEFFC